MNTLITRPRSSVFDSFFGDNFFNSWYVPSRALSSDQSSLDWSPSVDLIEKEKSYLIKAELPGIEEKDVSIELDDGILTLKGEKKSEYNEEKDNIYRNEIYHGSFARRFRVGEVDQENVSAKFKNGILKIELPKLPSRVPKKIDVKIS